MILSIFHLLLVCNLKHNNKRLFFLISALEKLCNICVAALELAFDYGQPNIFNTDQESQFTTEAFITPLLAPDIHISIDGRGRALENIFIGRLWRSVKYEDIYIKGYEPVGMLHDRLETYFRFYNYERPHQSLTYATPTEIYFGSQNQSR